MMSPDEAREWERQDEEARKATVVAVYSILLFGVIAIGTFTFALGRGWGFW